MENRTGVWPAVSRRGVASDKLMWEAEITIPQLLRPLDARFPGAANGSALLVSQPVKRLGIVTTSDRAGLNDGEAIGGVRIIWSVPRSSRCPDF